MHIFILTSTITFFLMMMYVFEQAIFSNTFIFTLTIIFSHDEDVCVGIKDLLYWFLFLVSLFIFTLNTTVTF